MADKKRLFTGLQPSGQLHIGNYFGALKPLADLAFTDHYASIMLMVADYHALTTLKNGKELRKNIVSVVKDYLAVLGDNAKKVTIFKQSDVPQHTELTWIFNCVITESFLELGHAYKDKKARGLESNMGLKDYPVLMAADILLYSDPGSTTWVPVGDDQEQHIEYTREIAAKFNIAFKSEEQIFSYDISRHKWGDSGKIPGVDGQKMSKSYKNTIPLFASPEEIKSAVMSIKTASVSVGDKLPTDGDIVLTILQNIDLPTFDDTKKRYENGTIGYKDAKDILLKTILDRTQTMRAVRDNISDEMVIAKLEEGAEKAKLIAEEKMKKVRKVIGVSI